LEAPPADSGAFDAAEDFQNLLAKAWRFSNQGLLPEAASLCRRLIQLKPHHSEAQFLMGLISDAGNDYSAAEQHYLKALYLDPGRSETLLHLALFYELRGNIEQAKLYRERLARISDCDSS
jgi:chemotaxis protein methyltransferase WspC